MVVTNEVFLWVNGILIASILAFIGSLWKIRNEISPLCQIAKRIQLNAIDSWLEQRGLNIGSLSRKKSKGHNSLSAENAAEREALTAKGKQYGLNQLEANRLKELLEEDARNDFANGLIGFLALAALVVLIGALVKSLSRSS